MATTLKIGSKGQAVKDLQKSLGIKADGIFGSQTQAAVKAYQSSNNLSSDGIVGSKTQSSLSSGRGSSGGGSSSSSSSDSIKSQQRYLNSLGANLSVDGKMGPLTQAAISKYSGGSSVSNTKQNSTPATPIRQTQGTSYAATSSKAPLFGNPFSGGFLNNVIRGAKNILAPAVKKTISDSITTSNNQGSSVLKAKTLESILLPDGSTKYLSNPLNPAGIDYSLEGFQAESGGTGSNIPGFVKGVKETANKAASTISDKFSTQPSMASADNQLVAPAVEPSQTSSTMDGLISTEGQGLNPDITGEGNLYEEPTTESAPVTKTSSLAVKETPVLDQGAALMAESSPSSPSNAVILNNINNLNTGLKNDLNGSSTAWMSSGSKGEFQNTKTLNYTSNVASQFDTPEQAIAFYKTPEGINSLPQGVKPEDIISKVKPVVNGVVGEQTTPEYLTKLGQAPAALAGEKKIQEQMMQMVANNATDYEKTILSQAEKDKQEAITKQEAIREKTLRDENTVRDRALLAKDELIAKQQEDLADVEINRVQSKANLTEFLAKIGALDTSGNAKLGLETLEQKYQALKLKTKNSYDFAIRQNEIDMTDKLNNLDSDMDAKIIDINSDLSKSEREVQLDIMKLRFDTKMKGLDYVSKFQDSIKTENEKARAKSEKITSDYNAMLLDLMVDKNVPFDIAKTMINSKGQVNATQKNVDTLKSFNPAKLPETKPKYEGQSLNIKDTKLAKLRTDLNNLGVANTNELINTVRDNLASGWSIDQIALNLGLMENELKVFNDYVVKTK